MDFNLDDPLAGILSDGSDDSFFDDDILGTKKNQKKKTTPIAEKKIALFDLGDNATKTISSSEIVDSKDINTGTGKVVDNINLKPSIKSDNTPIPFRRTTSKDSIDFQSMETKTDNNMTKLGIISKSPSKQKLLNSSSVGDKMDVLNELIIEKKKEAPKPLERGKSSQSLLDDILGGPSTKSSTSQLTRPTTAAKSQDLDLDTILGKSDSKPTLPSTKPSKQSIKSEVLKPDVQPKKENQPKKKSSDDWLGIFQDKNNDEEDDTGMPSWLTGGESKTKKVDDVKKTPSKPKPQTPELNEPKETEKVSITETLPLTRNLDQLILPPSNMMRGSNEDITTEGAALYLQQQESQLMVALQLKAQEEKLAAMQKRQEESARVQREASRAHHSQVEAILQRQADNRRQMQTIIANHQDRITERIKALLGPVTVDGEVESDDNYVHHSEETRDERRETPHMKEKKQLLQLVQTLQENHDKEIDLMETSYRRQLAFLEVSLNQSEERMKEESDKVTKFYTEKLQWLEEHHQMYKKHIEDNMDSIAERHKAENEMLRQQYVDNIRILREHHSSLMENINHAMKQEQTVIHDSTGFSSNLLALVADVKESRTQFQQLVDKVQTIAETSHKDTDRSLQVRETQIDDMLQQLKRERENFETEKNESRDLVKLLENRLKHMTSLIEEESGSLKQKRMEFEFEKATFNKQTEFAKNVLKKQDEEIKMIKDDIQKEYQDKLSRIEEEKAKAQKDSLAIVKEKSTIQSLRQDLEKMKAELQAQLEEVNDERSKLSYEKQQMHMEEQRILAKSRDLDLLAKAAVEKQTQADKKLSEAEFIQRKYEERIRRIQEHVVSLNSREKQIAKEKVALSRERLSIHNERKQLEGKAQCSLCRNTQYAAHYTNDMLPESFLNVPVSRDYGGANVTAVESEMANLIGRNYVRHSIDSNLNNIGTRDSDIGTFDEKFDTLQRDIGQSPYKEIMDPRFMMLRLDVQQVLSNLDQSKRDVTPDEQTNEEHKNE